MSRAQQGERRRSSVVRLNWILISSDPSVFFLSINISGPLHRYTFGIGWKDSTGCAHIDHKDSFNMSSTQRKRKPSSINRVVPFHRFRHLVQFPYECRLCGNHLIALYVERKEQQVTADELNTFTELNSCQMQIDKSGNLDNTNALLIALQQSPLRSQATVRLEDQAPGAIRRLTNKFRQAVLLQVSCIDRISFCVHSVSSSISFKCCWKYCTRPERNATAVSSTRWYQRKALIEYFNLVSYIGWQGTSGLSSQDVRGIRREELAIRWTSSYPVTDSAVVGFDKSKAIQEKFSCSSYALKTACRLKHVTDTPLDMTISCKILTQEMILAVGNHKTSA